MLAASSVVQRAREAVRRQPPFQLALGAYERGRYLDALRAWKDASQLGDPEADYRIGLLYEKGEGVRGSMPDAVVWYERAAAAGHVEAQYKLGLIYRYGVKAQLGPRRLRPGAGPAKSGWARKPHCCMRWCFPMARASL